jgi:hypothetical protein
MTGNIAFAQKLSILRKGAREGIAGETFLLTICAFICMVGGMMADASSLTLEVIRAFDTENLCLAELCEKLETYLDQNVWLFFKAGLIISKK